MHYPKKIYNDAIDAIGHTPLVRLNKIPKEFNLKCEILAKCEFASMGGSSKDRIGARMIQEVEPGKVVLEATSGNTGIGLALACAVKDIPLTVVMPEKMSQEKEDLLIGMGVEVIRTKVVPFDHPGSVYNIAKKMGQQDKYIYVDQFTNQSNPDAHYCSTAEEILWQCDGRVDAVVVAVGTGGSITGIGRKIHERLPKCKIIGVDPYGSILAQPEELNKTAVKSFKVEGVGKEFIPQVLSREVVDEWVKVGDKETFLMARKLIREEGMLCGASAGAAVMGAIKWAQKQNLDAEHRVVVLIPDTIRNYMTKHLSDVWMVVNQFMDYNILFNQGNTFANRRINEIELPLSKRFEARSASVQEILPALQHQIGVPLMEDQKIVGVVYQRKLLKFLSDRKVDKSDLAIDAASKDFVIVPSDIDISIVQQILNKEDIIFIDDGIKYVTSQLLLNIIQ